MPVRDVIARIRLRADTQGADEAKRALDEVGEAGQRAGEQGAVGMGRLGSALDGAKTAALGFVAAVGLLVRELAQAAFRGADFAQELTLVASGLGLSEGRARELERVLNRTGQDMSDLRGIVAGLNSAVGEAAAGNDTYASALRRLGLEATVLKGLDTEGLILRIVEAILALGEIDADEFSIISGLLGDDDATRIIAAAGDLKDGILAEIKISDEEIKSALNLGRIKADAENAVQDAELGAAAAGGSVGGSVGGNFATKFAEGLGGLVTAIQDKFGAEGPIETALKAAFGESGSLSGVTRDYLTRTRTQFDNFATQLSHSETGVGARVRKDWGANLGLMAADTEAWVTAMATLQSGLEQQFRDSFAAMREAALFEYRQAHARLRAISISTGETGNPAAQAAQGGLGLEGDYFGTALPVIRTDNAERGLQANAPDVNRRNDASSRRQNPEQFFN